MLLSGPHDPLKLLLPINYYFQLLTPRDYPLTPFYPCTTQSPVKQ